MGDATAVKIEQKAAPLVVDLDGTLLRSNLLLERALAYARTSPLHVVQALAWSMQGSQALRRNLNGTDLDVAVLPYDPSVVAMITRARAEGRPVALVASAGDSV